jgi:shikimate kinase
MNNNIILIGMPGAGKSTIGVLLAKALSFSFVDTDLLVQQRIQMSLQDIIDTKGIQSFLTIEEEVILSLRANRHVIATGGSVVYRQKAMEHLASTGIIVYFDVPLPVLRKRLKNITTRGIVMEADQSLASVYDTRHFLYENYADMIITCKKKSMEEIVDEIMKKVRKEFT